MYAWGGGLPAHAPSLSSLPVVVSPHRIICPPGHHLSLYQHTEAHQSLHQTPLPLYHPLPRYACRIPNAAPLSLPKYLLMSHSAASKTPFSVTTALGASPLSRSLQPYRKSTVSDSTPPNPPLLPAACKGMPPVSGFPLPWSPLPLPCFFRSRPSSALPSALPSV